MKIHIGLEYNVDLDNAEPVLWPAMFQIECIKDPWQGIREIDDIMEWLDDNQIKCKFGSHLFVPSDDEYYDNEVIYFKCSADAMAFKLRWS